jgi:hypothetical protein
VTWRLLALVAVALAGVIVAIVIVTRDPDEKQPRATPPSTSAPGPNRFDPTALDGPGTDLVDGFVAPPHTRVIGIDDGGAENESQALLYIEAEPSAVARDLVRQAVDRGARWGYPVYQYCRWSTPGTTTTSTTAMPSSITGPPGPLPDGFQCDTSFTMGRGDRDRSVSLTIQWGRGTAHAYLEAHDGGDATGTSADLSSPPTDPDPLMPSGVDLTLPRVGEPFGAANNCMFGSKDRFVVPEGAQVIAPWSGTAGFWDFVAFLRTDDPKRTVADLEHQITAGRSPGNRTVTPRPVGGTMTWATTEGNDAGGGGCGVHSTTTGQVVVATHGD